LLDRTRTSFRYSVGSIVFGMEDGTVSIFGLVFGVAAVCAGLSRRGAGRSDSCDCRPVGRVAQHVVPHPHCSQENKVRARPAPRATFGGLMAESPGKPFVCRTTKSALDSQIGLTRLRQVAFRVANALRSV